MKLWKTEIKETSNNVYKLIMTHELGPVIEKTGVDIEKMQSEALEDSIKIEKDIEKNFKTNHNNT